jgi:hypothetical protein
MHIAYDSRFEFVRKLSKELFEYINTPMLSQPADVKDSMRKNGKGSWASILGTA